MRDKRPKLQNLMSMPCWVHSVPQAMQRTTSKIQIQTDSQKTAEVESDSKFQKNPVSKMVLPVQKTIAVESEPVIEQQIQMSKK